MFLIAGLGNPDKKYQHTKHNTGFDAADAVAGRFGIAVKRLSKGGVYGKGRIEGEKAIILKPLTYMNLSGTCVAAFAGYYGIDPKTELVVIYDDADLPAGQLRIRQSGSAGSHNGMKNIIECLGTTEFTRIRIGIGPRPEKQSMYDYVLTPFSGSDRAKIDECIDGSVNAVSLILKGEANRAMELYNKKVKPQKEEI